MSLLNSDVSNQPGIYKIVNTKNNKCYVGSTNNLKRRLREHRSQLHRGIDALVLQRAWNKYGDDSFEFEILEYCDDDITHSSLLEREQYHIDCLRPAYNAFPFACGVEITDEHRAKVKEGLHKRFSKEELAARVKHMTSFIPAGFNKTKEYREKLRKSTTKLWKTKEYRNKVLSSVHGNRKLSESQVSEIRRLYSLGYKPAKLFPMFGVSKSTIKAIVSKRLWKDVK